MLINVPLFSLTEIAADDLQQNQKPKTIMKKDSLFLFLYTSVSFIIKKLNESYHKELIYAFGL